MTEEKGENCRRSRIFNLRVVTGEEINFAPYDGSCGQTVTVNLLKQNQTPPRAPSESDSRDQPKRLADASFRIKKSQDEKDFLRGLSP